MGIAHEYTALVVSLLSFGLGGTLLTRRVQRLVVKLFVRSNGAAGYTLLMMQDSAGAVIGALLGSWLLQYDFRFGLRDRRCSYYAPFFSAWLLPARKLSTVRTPVREGMRRVMSDKGFVTYI